MTPLLASNVLTLTGDAAGENITLGVAGANVTRNLPVTGQAGVGLEDATDFDPGNGAKVTVPSNGTVNLVVNAGGGNDNVNVQAASFAAGAQLNGGDGDDISLGTAAVDQIDGGEGNDRITAFRGDETAILGGNGNDVLIWTTATARTSTSVAPASTRR